MRRRLMRDEGLLVGPEGAATILAVEKLYAQGKKRSHPFTIPRVMGNAGASLLSMKYGLRGPVFTLSTACSSSNHAMGQAFWLVRDGVADAALVGATKRSSA